MPVEAQREEEGRVENAVALARTEAEEMEALRRRAEEPEAREEAWEEGRAATGLPGKYVDQWVAFGQALWRKVARGSVAREGGRMDSALER